MGLVETWMESQGNEGRVKQIRTTFDPQWVRDAQSEFVDRRVDDGGGKTDE